MPVRFDFKIDSITRLEYFPVFPYNFVNQGSDFTGDGGNEVAKDNGLIQIPSRYSVEETAQRLQAAFEAKGLQVFVVIDHSGEAEKVGLKMRPTKLVIFGSPKAGTPLMVAAPSLAIDLPLKALVAEDAGRKGVSDLQRSRIPEAAAWRAGGLDQESCGRGNCDRQGCGIMLAASLWPGWRAIARPGSSWTRERLSRRGSCWI